MSPLQEDLARATGRITDAWAKAVEALLADTPGISPATHTLVSVPTAGGGMMAWVCPNNAVSGAPRFPRVVLKWSGLNVTVGREVA